MPWILGGAALWCLALLLFLQHLFFSGISSDFDSRRQTLNASLRNTLLELGINIKERKISETWEKISDEKGEWEALTWRVRVKPEFDFHNARHSLISVIEGVSATPVARIDLSDEEIPLVVEAHIEKRLSHRIYFIITQPSFSPALAINAEAFLGNRWQRLSAGRRDLDYALYSALMASGFNGPPLLIREYYQSAQSGDASGEDVFHWVISNSRGIELGETVEELRNLIPAARFALSSAGNGPGDEMSTLDVVLGGELSHRIIFTGFHDGRGIRLKKEAWKEGILLAPPRVAIIIDDIGFDTEIAERFLELEIPITLSIIPNLPKSRILAERTHLRGRETILHLPMEPESYPESDPGRGAILVDMSPEQIKALTTENIDAVPHISGVNNHMGSRAMTNRNVIQEVLEVIRIRDLYFIDSRTSSQTLGYTLARQLNIPASERSVFIDSTEIADTDYSVQRLKELIQRSKQKGTAVGIGHPRPETLEALKRMTDEFRKAGVEIVYASEVVS